MPTQLLTCRIEALDLNQVSAVVVSICLLVGQVHVLGVRCLCFNQAAPLTVRICVAIKNSSVVFVCCVSEQISVLIMRLRRAQSAPSVSQDIPFLEIANW